jgi:hypothetical protein
MVQVGVSKYTCKPQIDCIMKYSADITMKDNEGKCCLESAFEHDIPVQLILQLTKNK